jgi:myo-inositol 2-dehydrogenase/D-chiro-inositol 1-dehydrogenase
MRRFSQASNDPAPPAPVSIGIIGCGRVATEWHLPALRALPGAGVAALADLDSQRLERAAERFGVERRHRDPADLIDDPAIEAVAICVPAPAHAELAVPALKAGKHVLVEKPLASSLADCDRMIEAAGASDAVATVGFNMRHHRLVRRAREIVRSGKLGPVSLLQTTLSGASEPDAPDWIRSRELGGGVLLEKGIHHYDLWHHLLGTEVEKVSALSRSESMDDQTAVVSARMSDGAIAVSTLTESSQAGNDLRMLGERGRLDLSLYEFDGMRVSPATGFPGDARARVRALRNTARELPGALRPRRRGGDFSATYASEWQAFVASIRTGAPVACGLEDGRRAVAVALAAISSSQRGESVAVAELGPEHAIASEA